MALTQLSTGVMEMNLLDSSRNYGKATGSPFFINRTRTDIHISTFVQRYAESQCKLNHATNVKQSNAIIMEQTFTYHKIAKFVIEGSNIDE